MEQVRIKQRESRLIQLHEKRKPKKITSREARDKKEKNPMAAFTADGDAPVPRWGRRLGFLFARACRAVPPLWFAPRRSRGLTLPSRLPRKARRRPRRSLHLPRALPAAPALWPAAPAGSAPGWRRAKAPPQPAKGPTVVQTAAADEGSGKGARSACAESGDAAASKTCRVKTALPTVSHVDQSQMMLCSGTPAATKCDATTDDSKTMCPCGTGTPQMP